MANQRLSRWWLCDGGHGFGHGYGGRAGGGKGAHRNCRALTARNDILLAAEKSAEGGAGKHYRASLITIRTLASMGLFQRRMHLVMIYVKALVNG